MSSMPAVHLDADDVSYEEARPGALLTLTGVAVGAAGMCTAAIGGQFLFIIPVYGWIAPLPYLFVVAGVVSMILGGLLTQGRAAAAWLTIPTLLGTSVLTLGWLIYTTMSGLFSLMVVFGMLALAPAALLAPFAVPAAMRVTRARKQLYA